MVATDQTFTDKEFTELVGKLPLDSEGGANYDKFLERVRNVDPDPSPAICAKLKGQPRQKKLALLLACIWAKVRVGEQDEPLAVKAVKASRNIMVTEEVAFERNALLAVLGQFRKGFQAYGSACAAFVDKSGYAEAAEHLLQALERIGELEG